MKNDFMTLVSSRVGSPPPVFLPSKRLDRLMAEAAGDVRLLGSVTPIDAHRERARVILAFEAGFDACPRWEYVKVDRTALFAAIAGAEAELARVGSADSSPATKRCLALYAARLREIDLEARVACAAGTDAIASLARERFADDDGAVATAANALATEWLATSALEAPKMATATMRRSDASDDPRSLLSRMREEVGRRRLPFNVIAHSSLAPLAATGARTIFVATDRDVSDEDVERTVLHEIEGHAMPRVRAAAQPLRIFAIGTARGADDHEGYALVLEERAGHLVANRRTQLAARHAAVNAMWEGATFVDAVRLLIRDLGRAPRDAVLAAERAYRGGNALTPGLGRDRIYLEAFLRVSARLAAQPGDERVLASGTVSVDAIEALHDYVAESTH